MDLYSLYLHVPFCSHRCSYCDFNTFAGQENQIPAYVKAICAEIRQVSDAAPGSICAHSIFFGGGTPSLLSTVQIETVLNLLKNCFNLTDDVEITLEANPGTVSAEYFARLRAAGVNRLSLGMQSAHPEDLGLLERQHNFFDVTQAVRWARLAGFENISLDLIFGLPGQTLERWKETLERALAMGPEHLSLYALTIEHGTPLQRRWARGLIPLVDDDLAADMYEHAMDRLPQVGFEQYEISNWARFTRDEELLSCRHNMQYWLNQPYLGFGPGAHGSAAGFRTMNVKGIRPYIDRCQAGKLSMFPAGPAARKVISIDRQLEMQETMMVGLRLTRDGVSSAGFQRRFGSALEDEFAGEIQQLIQIGLLEWTPGLDSHLRLTRRGRLLGNQVFMQFVS